VKEKATITTEPTQPKKSNLFIINISNG